MYLRHTFQTHSEEQKWNKNNVKSAEATCGIHEIHMMTDAIQVTPE